MPKTVLMSAPPYFNQVVVTSLKNAQATSLRWWIMIGQQYANKPVVPQPILTLEVTDNKDGMADPRFHFKADRSELGLVWRMHIQPLLESYREGKPA